MLHHHAGVLLDDDDDDVDISGDLHQNIAATDATDQDIHKVQLLIVGGGGNCFSFGTHFNRHPMMLTISLCRWGAACDSADVVS